MATATFIKTDPVAQGNWKGGSYGGDGYYYLSLLSAGVRSSLPSYISGIVVSGANTYDWGVTATRGLYTPDYSAQYATTWYNTTQFVFTVTVTDSATHLLAIYSLDQDTNLRRQSFNITDTSDVSLATATLSSSYNAGVWTLFTFSGSIKVKVNYTSGNNAVVGGLFFGPDVSDVAYSTGNKGPVFKNTQTLNNPNDITADKMVMEIPSTLGGAADIVADAGATPLSDSITGTTSSGGSTIVINAPRRVR